MILTSAAIPLSSSVHLHTSTTAIFSPAFLSAIHHHTRTATPHTLKMNAQRILSRRTLNAVAHAQRHQFSTTPSPAVTAFQSYTLPSHPPSPPRSGNDSMAFPVQPPMPRVHETRPHKIASPPQQQLNNNNNNNNLAQQTSSPSTSSTSSPSQPTPAVPSKQQEQTKTASAAAQPSTAPTQPTPSKPAPRASRLRAPRKAAMKLTPAAVEQLRAMLDQPDPKLIKVGVRNRGCSGLAYHLEYVDKPGAFDETVEQDGVKVLIDSKALFSIIGSEMDWVEDKLSQRFVFRNPNIKEQCGCGESFMV
ncbi:hypothetical protein QBC32DRAFT_340056 [Pseudoneurospora amorphoporcata]|uniref:Iron-sulfur assembly protein 1 n=1 Tax=Pseudoneurospora amorphoporcata TaxID=241081 RepID=A0AAN6NXP5_9PEZI|nr:hypothetical protein QBC32DRAFT_340056 [Pseudoneurospora amorphoporcata]